MTMQYQIRSAKRDDWTAILALLSVSHLPTQDLTPENAGQFLVADAENCIIGTIGYEPHEPYALFRSLAVHPTKRGCGIGIALNMAMEQYCADAGYTAAYILTTTAEIFARKEGYSKIRREDVPPAIQLTAQYSALCPRTAACMFKELKKRVQQAVPDYDPQGVPRNGLSLATLAFAWPVVGRV